MELPSPDELLVMTADKHMKASPSSGGTAQQLLVPRYGGQSNMHDTAWCLPVLSACCVEPPGPVRLWARAPGKSNDLLHPR
jgi:hypothetical protein